MKFEQDLSLSAKNSVTSLASSLSSASCFEVGDDPEFDMFDRAAFGFSTKPSVVQELEDKDVHEIQEKDMLETSDMAGNCGTEIIRGEVLVQARNDTRAQPSYYYVAFTYIPTPFFGDR